MNYTLRFMYEYFDGLYFEDTGLVEDNAERAWR